MDYPSLFYHLFCFIFTMILNGGFHCIVLYRTVSHCGVLGFQCCLQCWCLSWSSWLPWLVPWPVLPWPSSCPPPFTSLRSVGSTRASAKALSLRTPSSSSLGSSVASPGPTRLCWTWSRPSEDERWCDAELLLLSEWGVGEVVWTVMLCYVPVTVCETGDVWMLRTLWEVWFATLVRMGSWRGRVNGDAVLCSCDSVWNRWCVIVEDSVGSVICYSCQNGE